MTATREPSGRDLDHVEAVFFRLREQIPRYVIERVLIASAEELEEAR